MPVEVRLPELAESMTAAKVVSWLKCEGDLVVTGEPLAEVETDKTNVELEAPASGLLEKIHVPAGTDAVAVGTLLAIIVQQATDAEVPRRTPSGPSAPSPADASQSRTASEVQVALPDSGADVFSVATPQIRMERFEPLDQSSVPALTATPLAARMAALAGLELAAIRPAQGERITKADVERALKGRRPVADADGGDEATASVAPQAPGLGRPSPSGPFEDRPLSAMRRVTASRLQQAKQTIPHFYLHVDCGVDALIDLRATINARKMDLKITVTDFIVLATALALRKVPAANSAWVESAVRFYNSVDISVAVSTPNGLITPVIRGSHLKTLAMISRELKSLSERARRGQLKPDEYTGGTFTISNLGMFGVTGVSPIINPPQSAILGIGTIEQRPVARAGQLAVGHVMTCTLAADHRAIDGATGAELLAEFRRFIEDPMRMVLAGVMPVDDF